MAWSPWTSESVRDWREWWWHPNYWPLLVALPWLVGLIVFLYQWQVYSHAANNQAATSGVVTSVGQGNRVHYQFAIGQQVYRNEEIPLDNRRVPKVGEAVTVYYDNHKPGINSITEFHTKSWDAFGPVPVLLLATGGLVFAITAHVRRRRVVVQETE
jgi:hypothetical protein